MMDVTVSEITIVSTSAKGEKSSTTESDSEDEDQEPIADKESIDSQEQEGMSNSLRIFHGH